VGKRVVLDCSHGEVIGWECPNRFGKFKEWPVYGRIDWMGLALVGLVGFAFYRWMMGKPIVPAFKLIGGVA
jgi:hypothetical protein